MATRDNAASMNRIALNSAQVLKYAGAGFVLTFALGILASKMGVYYLVSWCGIGMFVSLIAGLIAGAIRVCSSIFTEIQIRMGELIVTLLAGGTFAALVNGYFKSDFPPENEQLLSAIVSATIFLFTGIGSAWAWSAAKDLGTDQTVPRLSLMAAGWLLLPGTLALCWFSFVSIFFLVLGFYFDPDWEKNLLTAFLISLLTIPGIVVERRRRCAMRYKAQVATPLKTPLTPPAVDDTKQI